MRWQMFPCLALVSLLALLCGSEPAVAAYRGILVKNVDVFDGVSSSLAKDRNVLIKGGAIVKVGGSEVAPPTDGYKEIDAKGKGWTLMPPFVDAHAHIWPSGGLYTDPEARVSQADNLRTQALAGILTVADLHNPPETVSFIRQTAGYVEFPKVFYSGLLFTAPGGHGTQFGMHAREISDVSDVEGAWEAHNKQRPHLTKAVLEPATWLRLPGKPIKEWPTLDPRSLNEIGRLSHKAEKPFFVHVWTNEHALMAAQAKADVLAHGIFTGPVQERVIEAMAKAGTAYVPTLSVVLNRRRAGTAAWYSPLKDQLCPDLVERVRKVRLGSSPPLNSTREEVLGPAERFFDNLKKMHAAGVPLGIGTDAGNPLVFHGPSVHREIDYFLEAGIPLTEVMRIATSGSIRLLGKGASLYGQVKPGYMADLILVKGNPLKDPDAHWNVVKVIRKGLVVPLDKIRKTITREDCLVGDAG